MAVPKKRTAPSKRDMRRSHHARIPVQLFPCPKCQTRIRPHIACYNCGEYQGREVIDIAKKLSKKQRKDKEKARERNT